MIRDRIIAALTRRRFQVTTEAKLADAIAGVLVEDGFDVRREVEVIRKVEMKLTEEGRARGLAGSVGGERIGRIDFVVDRCGLELKVQGGDSEVLRQVHRYAGSGCFDELLLITTRARHRALRTVALGIPFDVIVVGGFA